MNHRRTEENWYDRFEVTHQDLDRIAYRIGQAGTPQDLLSIALPLLKDRLEHGQDSSGAAFAERVSEAFIRLWDPGEEWQVGDGVLLVYDRFGNSRYELLLGEIQYVDQEAVEISIETLQLSRTYLRIPPGSAVAQKYGPAVDEWRDLILDLVGRRQRSSDLQERAEGILLTHGGRILTGLADSLRQDARFIGLGGKWFLVDRLPHIEGKSLQAIHHFLLQQQPASLDEIVLAINDRPAADENLLKMALQAALQNAPGCFEKTGTSSRPLWNARLPDHNRARVTHFAFDPRTFEILCRPGHPLNLKKARRLQELDLYAHVVTFLEWGLQAGA